MSQKMFGIRMKGRVKIKKVRIKKIEIDNNKLKFVFNLTKNSFKYNKLSNYSLQVKGENLARSDENEKAV
jgi:hypothetical protein